MRFLKTLQKARIDERKKDLDSETAAVQNGSPSTTSAPPPFADVPDFAIGRPSTEASAANSIRAEPPVVRSNRLEDIRKHIRPIDDTRQTSPEIKFGSFTLIPEAVNPRIVAISDPNSPYCEDYRALRTQIINHDDKKPVRSIVIASHGSGEGKTVTAINLACMFAQTEGITALLIDGDLRRPYVSNYLGMETSVGLSEALSGKADLGETILRLDPPGLFFLPAGKDLENVTEVASGPRFKEFLNKVSGMFDFVIIDAPPLGLFADGAAYMNHADAALLVVRSNRVSYSAMERTLETLPREKILGAILNESEEALTSKGYYEYSYYYSSRKP